MEPRHLLHKKLGVVENNMPGFWTKEIWPPNLPDLSRTSGYFANQVGCMEPATNLNFLEKQLILAWKEISPENLVKVITGMPGRISKCLKLHGDYIGK